MAEAKTLPIAFRINKELLFICLAFVMVRLPWIFVVPMAEAPDEFAHFWVIDFLRTHFRFPNPQEIAAGGPSAVYGSLAQLGYLPHVAMTLCFPSSEAMLFARFGSLLCGLFTVYFAWRLGRELFPREHFYALALPCLIIFHPQLVFLHIYSNNDATAAALVAGGLLFLIQNLKYGLDTRRAIYLGLLVGYMALGKTTGYCLFPVVLVSTVASALINSEKPSRLIKHLALIGAIAGLMSIWWFVRNYYVFDGDLLGTKTMYRSWALTFHRELKFHIPFMQIVKEKRWWRMMFFSYWGLFGYMKRYLWRPVYYVYLAFVCFAFAGFAKSWYVEFFPRKLRAQITKEKIIDIAVWSTLALTVAINIIAMIWASTTNLGGPQGRYLLTSDVACMALIVGGLARCGIKLGPKLMAIFAVFNAAVCFGSFFYLAASYGIHARPY